MNRHIAGASVLLLLLLALLLITIGTPNSPLLAQQGPQKGLFGRVTGITAPIPGVVELTLDTTAEGVQKVDVEVSAPVTIPSKETATAADVSLGDFLAVLAKTEDDRLLALMVLVKPARPVTYAHITGSLVGSVGKQVSIMDRNGNLVTADFLLRDTRIDPAEVVTTLAHQDLKTGNLEILGVEYAVAKMERLGRALQAAIQAGSEENQKNLTQRFRANSTGHLTTLQEVLNRVDPGLKFLFTDRLESTIRTYQPFTTAFGLGNPTLKLRGVIQATDPAGASIFVSPREGPQVRLKLTQETLIRRFGEKAAIGNLETGQRIESVYDPQSNEADSVDVIFPSLSENLTSSLLAQLGIGELDGTVDEVNLTVDPSVVVIRLATDERVALISSPQTRVKVSGELKGLEDLVQAARVKVRFEPTTLEALEVETYDIKPGQAFISGVVEKFIPKISPIVRMPGNIESGNVTVRTPQGESTTLNITDASVIERDGIRTNIGAIKLGDLVRPNSRYNSDTREVQQLMVRTPTLLGTVRGKGTTPAGRKYITISTDDFNLVTVTIAPDAEIIHLGESADFGALKVGERVVSGLYNPFTLQSVGVAVQPPKTLRIAGTISDLDQQFFILTLTPEVGASLELLVPNKPGIITLDGDPTANFNELKVGDTVQAAFYRPNRVVVGLAVKSQ